MVEMDRAGRAFPSGMLASRNRLTETAEWSDGCGGCSGIIHKPIAAK